MMTIGLVCPAIHLKLAQGWRSTWSKYTFPSRRAFLALLSHHLLDHMNELDEYLVKGVIQVLGGWREHVSPETPTFFCPFSVSSAQP